MMIPSNIFMITLAILILILIHHSHSAPLTFDVKVSWCQGSQYSQNSTFQSNLNALFNLMNSSSLTINFFNGSFGRDSSNRVYGLYFCTGDLPQSDCRNCITTATSNVIQLCPTNREGIVWYDYCELRYSDQNFLGVLDSRGTSLTNPLESLLDPSQPLEVVTQLVRQAPFNKPLMFAYNSSTSDNIYALAQCTNDLNSTSCSNCLNDILGKIKTCCSRARGWRYLAVSCWVRYEATPFLKNLNVPTEINEYRCSSDDFERTENVVTNQNLRSLLSILPSNASVRGFYNTSMGNNNNVVYGSGLCRADVSSILDCLDCLNMSANGLLKSCPNKTRGIFSFETCFVRYSNQNFFGIVDDDGRTYCNEQNTTLEANDAIVGLMSRLIEFAPNQPLMFASGNVSISRTLASYGLVQCSRDLSSDSCKNCLTTGLKNVSVACKQRKGWRYLSGSCTLRYEDFQFFNVSSSVVTNPPQKDNKGKSRTVVIAGVTTAILGAILFASVASVMWKKKKKRKVRAFTKHQLNASDLLIEREFQLMDIETAKSATNHFAETNKLGEGGFGPVYKGVLADGTEIAIKRLSSNSGQGADEFKNEVKLIAKLQHKNLVKLLGCCVENGEKLLVYEYLPNGSLDTFLVDPSIRSKLEWGTRRNLVLGITRGLIYLHEDSQLKVVHRDLKPSNILLDLSMNPKISDFGMARIFNNDENEANTKRVVGTFGYMAPEFAMAGLFSAKSDVFGFGVLLLEIITGQRNGHSHFLQYDQSLLIRTWNLWKEDNGQDLVDPSIAGTFPTSEAVRWIQIGLLCVQENPADRPKMSMVLRMFETEQMVLKEPNQPPSFMWQGVTPPQENSSKTPKYTSVNEVTVTDVEAR